MTLDTKTLAATYVLLSAILGMLLLLSWTRNRKMHALAWWGGAFCLVPVGIGMANLGQGAPSPLTLCIANALVALGYGSMYAGCRAFNGTNGRLYAVAIGPAVWIIAFPVIQGTLSVRVLLLSLISGGYAALSGWELWKHASDRLTSQRAAIILLYLLAAFNVIRGALGVSLGSLFESDVVATRWSAELAVFLVVYTPTLAFVFLAMAKEHIEAGQGTIQHALREGEEHYRYSVELNPQIPWTADPQGNIISASTRWHELTGMPVEEALGRGWIKALHPDDLPSAQQIWLHSVTSGNPFDAEYRLRHTDGSYRWFRARATARRSADGTIVRWYGTLEDTHTIKLATQSLREREYQLATVFGQTMVGVLHRGLGNEVLMVNRRFCDLVGRTRDELEGLPMRDFTHPEDFPRNLAVWEQHRLRGTPFQIEKRYTRPDGTATWCAVNVSFVRDVSGEVTSTITVAQDIDERKRAEDQSRESQENFRYLVELNPQIPWIADSQGRTIEISSRWLTLTGLSQEEALGGWIRAVHPDDCERAARKWAQAVATGKPYDDEFRLHMADGSYRWFRGRAMARWDSTGAIIRWYGTDEDVHDRKVAEERLRWAAYHDDLTGLPNRRRFQERLHQALEQAARMRQKVGLLTMDLDGFKQINDTFGHDVGDEFLRAFAEQLTSLIGSADLAARLGGDEFAVILPNIGDQNDISAVVNTLRARMKEPLRLRGGVREARISIGGAISDAPGASAEELLKQADLALYTCKAAGRGLYAMFEPTMRDEAQKRSSSLEVARQAIARDWFEPFYQPKIELGSGRLAGFEALLRWRHPRLGIQSPDTIAPAFDDPELGTAIGARMLSGVLSDMRRWLNAGLPFGRVSINASSADFRRDDYARRVLDQLREAGIPSARLGVEVTETVFLNHNIEHAKKTLHALSQGGVSIALDDFGTGYASLSHLKQFPVDVLKIDRSFVSNLETDAEDAAIVRAVLGLGQSLGIRVVAEGVETAAQASFLRALGCDLGQGYHFGRPMPAQQVEQFIASFDGTSFLAAVHG